jgi:uncharacterized protein YbjT (DUF2867 family)
MKIVVIGGTGLIGSKTVQKLKARGHEVLAAAPNTGVNTITGEGVAEALAGASVVIDVSNSPSFEEQAATDFFQTSGRNISAAEVNAGVRHHVALSVVGTDRLQASGYFRAKLAQEALIKSSPVPYSLLHATQFFEFIRTIADVSTTNGVVRLPPVWFQPMAAEDVADAVAELALGEPVNRTVEIGGPETFTLDHAVKKVLAFDRDPRSVVADPSAPYYGVQVTDMTLLPASGARLGSTRLDWWIENVPPPPKVAAAAAIPMPAH